MYYPYFRDGETQSLSKSFLQGTVLLSNSSGIPSSSIYLLAFKHISLKYIHVYASKEKGNETLSDGC